MKVQPFYITYRDLLQEVLASPAHMNQRTSSSVRVVPGGTSFKIMLAGGRLPVCGARRLFPATAAAEVAWQLRGTQEIEWLQRHTRIWDKFVEPGAGKGSDDFGPYVKNAYGYRWRRHFERDQIRLAIEALLKNPTDRQVYVSTWDPSQDGLGVRAEKNVPCPVGFSVSLLSGTLDMSVFMRSSDVFVGLPYDVMGFAMLQQAMAVSLSRVCSGPSYLHFTLAHAHLYGQHEDMARECIDRTPVPTELRMPDTWGVYKIADKSDDYVQHWKDECAGATWHPYNPRPEVIA